jgi:UDP-glucose 4,6-dehydratase
MYAPGTILITGGAGFIASHVARRLAGRYRLVVLDALDACASSKNLEGVDVTFVKGDIRSADLVDHVLQSHDVDTVMHFAAQTHVDNSFGNSLAFTMNNTYGTHVLLECCRRHGKIRRFINVSTDEVYGETSLGRTSGLTEASRLEPTNPYSAAKAGAEMMARAYWTSYALPVITTRGNNVYGPGQFPEKLIPKYLTLAGKGKPLPVHGDGLATRSYLYVDDVAEAFDIILHNGEVGQVYNIGTQKERTVLDVARDVSALFATDPCIEHVRDRHFNDRRYFICDAKLAALGWAERTSWPDGLRKTAAWYATRQNDHWDPDSVDAALRAHQTLKKS